MYNTIICNCNIIEIILFQYHINKERLRLYFYAGKIAHFCFTDEKVNKTDSLQPSGISRQYVYIYIYTYTL